MSRSIKKTKAISEPSKIRKYMKRLCNKRVRKYKKSISSHGFYKKISLSWIIRDYRFKCLNTERFLYKCRGCEDRFNYCVYKNK